MAAIPSALLGLVWVEFAAQLPQRGEFDLGHPGCLAGFQVTIWLCRPRTPAICLLDSATTLRNINEDARRASEWIIHGERVVDESRRAVLSVADVELPDGVRFEQYVLRLPRAAIVVVLDDDERLLMMWRHRFIIDRWVWELPGGYFDPDEDPVLCAVREVEEETGWRPRSMELLLSFQPAVGTMDQENLVFLARGADPSGQRPDINEAACRRLLKTDPVGFPEI